VARHAAGDRARARLAARGGDPQDHPRERLARVSAPAAQGLHSLNAAKPAPPALPISLVLAWAAPTLPLTFVGSLLSTYFLKFGTEALLIAPGALGVLFGLSRAWEGVASPLIGFYSDRTKSRLGRRRSWMLAAALPFALAIGMVWAPPQALAPTALLAWVTFGLFAIATATPCIEVPRLALPAELSSRSIDRTRLFAANGIATAVSGLFALTLGIGILRTAHDPRAAARPLVLALALVAIACLAWPVVRLREPPENLGRGARSPFRAWGQVLRNPHQQRIVLARFLQELPMGAISVLAPFAFQYTFHRPDLTEAYMLAFFVPHLASVPVWVRITRRFRKVDLWIASRAITATGYALLYFVLQRAIAGSASTPELLVPPVFLGVGMGCETVVPSAILAEVIDHDELVSGERKEGVYTAVVILVTKVASALGIALSGAALQWAGIAGGGAPDSRMVDRVMILAMAIVPGLCVTAAVLPLWRFALSESDHARVLDELARRRTGARAEAS
jgi:glycoside/pentoside/hexuronide:cation symporter, GPH family